MKTGLKQAHGNWVVGDKFWGRETELELLTARIENGAHTLLMAQRRMGKTSLMHELAQRLTGTGRYTSGTGRYTCLFIDLQGATSAEDAVVKLSLAAWPHKNLREKTKGIFANALAAIANTIDSINLSEVGIKLRAGMTPGDWAIKGDELFGVLAASDKQVLLLLDEVPIGAVRDLVAAQKNILWVLEHDGYLRKEGSPYVFVSKLLRDWWEARHGGLFYTPVAQRAAAKLP